MIRQKQNLKIRSKHDLFQILLSVVSQSSILGPILFNIFSNNLFIFIRNADIQTYTDYNISFQVSNIWKVQFQIQNVHQPLLLTKIIQNSSKIISWLTIIIIMVTIQSIIFGHSKTNYNPQVLKIERDVIKFLNSMKLKSEKYISIICNKASGQFNYFARLTPFLSED